MGTASSLANELPERMDIDQIEDILRKFDKDTHIDMLRFNLMKDRYGTVSRAQALQLIENKFPPIFSLNGAIFE